MSNDIQVTYVNATGHNDFILVVFTKNEDVNAIDTPFVAWQKIQAQTSATFHYPLAAAVGAHWETGGALIRAGPFEARMGTTWKLSSYMREDSPNLAEGMRTCMWANVLEIMYNYIIVIFQMRRQCQMRATL